VVSEVLSMVSEDKKLDFKAIWRLVVLPLVEGPRKLL